MVAVAYPALIMIIGALMYCWHYGKGKPWSYLGLIAFAIGLFFVVQMLAHTTAKL